LIIGLDEAAASGFIDNFRDGLRTHGYVEPRTVAIDLLFANYIPAFRGLPRNWGGGTSMYRHPCRGDAAGRDGAAIDAGDLRIQCRSGDVGGSPPTWLTLSITPPASP
jgi:hypothetical protein